MDLTKYSNLKCEDYVHSVNSNIIIVDTSKIQNPVDPAGPDCYRIDTKPCESL